MNEYQLETHTMTSTPYFSNTGDNLLFEDYLCAGSRLNGSGKDFTQIYLDRLRASRLKRPPSHL